MKRPWCFCALVAIGVLPARVSCLTLPVAVYAAVGTPDLESLPDGLSPNLPNDPDIPAAMLDVMRKAQLRYAEGSNLIKSGDSTRARAAFDQAVDLILESDWDLASTPVLNRFFQDLVRRIQQDESRYLRPADTADDKPESAVLDELEALDLIPITVDPSLKDVVESDLANTRYDIPIVLNDKVMASLNYWLNRGRKYFVEGLIRSGRYTDMIRKFFREESLPLDLTYLAQVESLFKTNAVSRARARGIWQFGRGTAIRYGLKVNSYVDERSDPEKSTRAAARYLSDLYSMFKDWNLVLAAYNWGEGKVLRLINRSGVNDFWDLMDLRRNFPRETKNHVPLIMASIILAKNPEKYGLPRDLDQPISYDRVTISKPIDLRAAARIMSISLEELKQLNPSIRGLTTPPNYPDFELKIPAGIEMEVAQKLAALPPAKVRPQPLLAGRYRVIPGDTLSAIAARYRVSVAALQEANDISAPRALRAGTWLRVPSSTASSPKGASTMSKNSPAAKAAGTKAISAGQKTAAKASAVKSAPNQVRGSRHSAAKAQPKSASKASAGSPGSSRLPRTAPRPQTPKKAATKETASR